MSKITLSPNASGTGVFTIASPNSSTDRTITLPDVTGTINTSGAVNEVPAGSVSAPAIFTTGDTNTGVFFPAADTLAWTTGGSERMRVDSSGNVGVGVTAGAPASGDLLLVGNKALRWMTASSGTEYGDIYTDTSNNMVFRNGSSTTERARIDSSGNLLVGTTSSTPGDPGNTNTGVAFSSDGKSFFSKSNGAAVVVARQTNDGTLVAFVQAGTEEGNISVSGTTVSYNAFAGSHWSQLQDGSKPEILRGTVMESINELCEWPDEPTSERLCRVKISDTAGSKKVYGVFMVWDNDWTATNDMLVTAVGAFVCRINKDVVVQEGDLLESNGDGTARVQADDVIRSSTIGKVTSTVKTHEHPDGSYCVPTVLYCG